MHIIEPARNIEVAARYDVVVVGGGIAGVAAAIAAARNGATVCLLEKEYAPGGLATLGLVVIYLPLCDGRGRLISTGLAEELLLLAVRDGSAAIPVCWRPGGDAAERRKHRYQVEFNPASYMLALEELLIAEGVTLLYDARVAAVSREGSRITAIVAETKAGRIAFSCAAAVDASGDADVAFFAGEETVSLDVNSASGWYYSSDGTSNRLHPLYKPYDSLGRELPAGNDRGYRGDSSPEVTAHLFASRRMIREHLRKMNADHPERPRHPVLIPVFPGLRMTRRLVGEAEFEADDGRSCSDSIGLVSDWTKAGPVYSVPFRALRGQVCRNLFATGRSVSAAGYGWNIARSIPVCAVTGEAAGTAAAQYGRTGDCEYGELRTALLRRGVTLDFEQLASR